MPHSGVVFPYGITLRKDGALDALPVAEISFFSGKGERLSLFLLIDSGAAISVLPASDASMLGISEKQGTPTRIAGIDGKLVKGWKHQVRVEIRGNALSIPIVFLENAQAPRILGREGVFDKFTLVLQEANHRSAVVFHNTKSSRAINKVFDELA